MESTGSIFDLEDSIQKPPSDDDSKQEETANKSKCSLDLSKLKQAFAKINKD